MVADCYNSLVCIDPCMMSFVYVGPPADLMGEVVEGSSPPGRSCCSVRPFPGDVAVAGCCYIVEPSAKLMSAGGGTRQVEVSYVICCPSCDVMSNDAPQADSPMNQMS